MAGPGHCQHKYLQLRRPSTHNNMPRRTRSQTGSLPAAAERFRDLEFVHGSNNQHTGERPIDPVDFSFDPDNRGNPGFQPEGVATLTTARDYQEDYRLKQEESESESDSEYVEESESEYSDEEESGAEEGQESEEEEEEEEGYSEEEQTDRAAFQYEDVMTEFRSQLLEAQARLAALEDARPTGGVQVICDTINLNIG